VSDLQILFLEAGKQTAADVAGRLAAFLAQARQTIDIAIYDMHLTGAARDLVVNALHERRRAGVQIRLCYDSGDNCQGEDCLGDEPETTLTSTFLADAGLNGKPIASQTHLMHQKYIILDAYTPQAQVWTGSSNFTDDSWTIQENNILIARSTPLANYYAQDFQELWSTADIQTTGAKDTGHVT
jgi:phosphatidylserine/phosphatidylglycerophosphate/cardiolipin synthase-like enzyme